MTEQISWVFFTIVYRIQTFLCYKMTPKDRQTTHTGFGCNREMGMKRVIITSKEATIQFWFYKKFSKGESQWNPTLKINTIRALVQGEKFPPIIGLDIMLLVQKDGPRYAKTVCYYSCPCALICWEMQNDQLPIAHLIPKTEIEKQDNEELFYWELFYLVLPGVAGFIVRKQR